MKITFRPIQENDLIARVGWINHPSVKNNMFFEYPVTIEKTRDWFNSLKNRANRIDFIAVDQNDKLIGMTGLTNIHPVNKSAEFHIIINPAIQGRGFGKQITRWIVNFGFIEKELNKIYLYSNLDNSAGYHMYKNLGFSVEGLLREQNYKNGLFVDRYFMGLLRSEWMQIEWKVNDIIYFINGE